MNYLNPNWEAWAVITVGFLLAIVVLAMVIP